MTISVFIKKVRNRWKKFRLQPIRAFCLHHVTSIYDAESMNRGDWMDINEFKQKIAAMQQDGVVFISLSDAYRHICEDCIRCRKYAVITFDDGYDSLKEVLPWLNEQHIPVTLFINGKYTDGKSYRKNPKEKYLTKEDLDTFYKQYPLLTIGSHGWEHTDASQMTIDEFYHYIESNVDLLHTHPAYIPFHAYTWNRHTDNTDAALRSKNIIPVYVDGMKNYNEPNVIHRELL